MSSRGGASSTPLRGIQSPTYRWRPRCRRPCPGRSIDGRPGEERLQGKPVREKLRLPTAHLCFAAGHRPPGRRTMTVRYMQAIAERYKNLGYTPYRWYKAESPPPWQPLQVPLAAARVGMLSTSGAY